MTLSYSWTVKRDTSWHIGNIPAKDGACMYSFRPLHDTRLVSCINAKEFCSTRNMLAACKSIQGFWSTCGECVH